MKKVFIDTDIIINFTKGFGDDLKELFDLQIKKRIELFTNPVVITALPGISFRVEKGTIKLSTAANKLEEIKRVETKIEGDKGAITFKTIKDIYSLEKQHTSLEN